MMLGVRAALFKPSAASTSHSAHLWTTWTGRCSLGLLPRLCGLRRRRLWVYLLQGFRGSISGFRIIRSSSSSSSLSKLLPVIGCLSQTGGLRSQWSEFIMNHSICSQMFWVPRRSLLNPNLSQTSDWHSLQWKQRELLMWVGGVYPNLNRI